MGEARSILLDLDGTLTDPAAGITASIRYALDRAGLPVDPDDDLRWAIGPPLRGTFARMLAAPDPAEVERILGFYRERYGVTGLYEATLHDGVPEVLETLASRGHGLFLATSKPRVHARRVLDHFGIAGWFTAIHGAELDGTNEAKPALLAHIVGTHGLNAAACVMIGDRVHDAIGAEAVGMPFLWARWGYGSEAEFPVPPRGVRCARDLLPLLAQM